MIKGVDESSVKAVQRKRHYLFISFFGVFLSFFMIFGHVVYVVNASGFLLSVLEPYLTRRYRRVERRPRHM